MSDVSKVEDALSAKECLGLYQLPVTESFEPLGVIFYTLVEFVHSFLVLIVIQVVVVLIGLLLVHEENPNQRSKLIDEHGNTRDDAQKQLVDSPEQNQVRVQLDALRSNKYELLDLTIGHREGSFGLGVSFRVISLISAFTLLFGLLIVLSLIFRLRLSFALLLFLVLLVLLLRFLSLAFLLLTRLLVLLVLLLLLGPLNGSEYLEGTIEEAQGSHCNCKVQVERLDSSEVG